ncbi:hypothetical protein EMIHUDRAFT_454192 [Emiliania huxleyi CCMP1516]|uniref:Protein kinase domain-containing protein n=2 Tax=Emiliania huxleyi TaxID=2903 RepID=A0A0D3KYB9_EMIH1|nr:hypothetical protein EMIHUDRAFT_454192 [Emiliania huxleyi CCMP1516]EOD40754.1 hypothetical protein EMIHUDRAFT_454192 [Emiliania huxleyi CCMP1516]|eukprot:XP_005793183.1 hypothetical protein EMIHUDRAFT_454192 [Emiliania huxleyi CCMP1516]
MAEGEPAEALCSELLGLPTDAAAAVVTRWLEKRGMSRTLTSFADEAPGTAHSKHSGGVCAAVAGPQGPMHRAPLARTLARAARHLWREAEAHGLAPGACSQEAAAERSVPPLQMASAAALAPPDARGGGDASAGVGSSKASAAASPARPQQRHGSVTARGSAHKVAPTAEALPVPGTSSRPGKLYDVEPLSAQQVPDVLLTKPDPIFHGERDERKRESCQLHDFAMMVHYDRFTSGLESETHFRVEEKQVIAGRYVVIQYLGSGTFCHTVQCEDLRATGRHRFVCVKISKNTKDIFDQNLWEVKLLKLLASQMTPQEAERLPLLLNVFYFRETLFIVYELLRDNLYHIYKYIEECRLPRYFTVERLRHVAKQCLLTLQCLHQRDVIHCDLKPENILISSLTACKIKVIDYGNAYLHHDQRCSYVQSRAYRAPEIATGLLDPHKKRMQAGVPHPALLASHIAVLGPLPRSLLREGALTDHYFADQSDAAQLRNGLLVSFITELVQPDPNLRPDAKRALNHPFLEGCAEECPPYRLTEADSQVEAGLRLLQKYTSLNDSHSGDGRSPHASGGTTLLGEEAGTHGPATPTAFREQCYMNRERLEKKRARKSGSSKLGGGSGEMPNLDHMVISNPGS